MSMNEGTARSKTEEGVRLFEAGGFEAAIEAFTEAIALDPNYPVAYHWRGMAYQALGRKEEAGADFAQETFKRWHLRPVSPMAETASRWRRFRAVPTDGTRGFHFAFAATAISVVALSVISTAGIYPLWFAAAALWGLAILVAIVAALIHQGQVASGVAAGIAIGMLSLAATCFANIAGYRW